MNIRKVIGLIILLAGIAFAFLSLMADQMGIGSMLGFGYKQSVGGLLGAVAGLFGIHLLVGSRRLTGFLSLLGGAALFVLSLIADLIGIGSAPGFGYNQIIGTVAGIIIVVVGFGLISKK